MKYKLLLLSAFLLVAACGPTHQVTRVEQLTSTSDAPYRNILVISLFKSFDGRRYFEEEIVKELAKLGVTAVASTSLMNTKVPATRETFLAMVEDLGSDAALVTQLVSFESEAKMKTMRPEGSYNYAPTYYFNVWNVEQVEYVEPEGLNLEHVLRLATQVFSTSKLEAVWAMETKTDLVSAFDNRKDISFINKEARSIVTQVSRAGLLAR